ncbi:XrtA system polysaccharide chain length determinant [Aliikangiella sp. IMCC44359]|uniref:XrtA system polysaccharide chain length determinant n=1 Tax=Aliikangiella sp. IMCC44359 TaxID=3459125 RepID=UPI00403AD18B
MKMSAGDTLKRVIREVWDRKVLVTVLFTFIALAFLVLAWFMPKVYTSSSIILVDNQTTLQPLMEGTAEVQKVEDRSKMARQIIFSRRSMDRILESFDWFDGDTPSLIEKDLMVEKIKKRTKVAKAGKNLIEIGFKYGDPKRAQGVAKLMTSIFVDDSLLEKQKESRDAYEFIHKRVESYQKKLQDAEKAIKEFRSRNIDSRPGSQAAVNERITQLTRQVENLNLEIRGQESKIVELTKQLSGDAVLSTGLQKENTLRERVAKLKIKLDELRLNYLDTYPDVVQVKSQINTLNKEIEKEIKRRESKSTSTKRYNSDSPIFQDIQRQITKAKTQISTLKSDKSETEKLLVIEQERMARINAVDAELAELSRDYKVNQDIYQKLLRQRENANISMTIDAENQGLTIKVQEEATLPVIPSGLRYIHIVAIGLILSILIPAGTALGLSIIDGKVRDESILTDKLLLPVLASVYYINTPDEKRSNLKKGLLMFLVALTVLSCYVYVSWLRLRG